jgi:hypothetical protein
VVGQSAASALQPLWDRQASSGQSTESQAPLAEHVTLQRHESSQRMLSHAPGLAHVMSHEPVPQSMSLQAELPWQSNVQLASPLHWMSLHAEPPWQVKVQVQPDGQSMSLQS